MESIFRSLERSARNTALMRTFGTNPRAAFESDIEQLAQRIKKCDPDEAQYRKLGNWYTHALFDQIDGPAHQANNPILAHRVAEWRAIQSMARLGQVTLSSFPISPPTRRPCATTASACSMPGPPPFAAR